MSADSRPLPRLLLADAQGRNGVENWRMGMQNIGPVAVDYFQKAFFNLAHQGNFTHAWQGQTAGWCRWRSIKVPAVDIFFQQVAADVLGRGQVGGFPAQLALFAQN